MKLLIFSQHFRKRWHRKTRGLLELQSSESIESDGAVMSGDVLSSRDEDLAHQDCGELEETPEVREQRVAELRQQVRDGTYEIPVAQLVRILASIVLRRN